MTKTNGLVLAAFLMASTSPMAFGQTTPPTPGTDTGTGTTTMPESGTGTGTGTTTTPGAGTGTGTATTPGTGTTTGTDLTTGADTADVDMEHSLLITSLTMESGDKDWEEEFSNLSDDAEVKIVQLSELKDSDSPSADDLDQAISDMEDGRSDLRAAIEDSDKMVSALEDEDYSADDVVAAVIQPGADNEVTLIVDTEDNDD